MSDECVTVIVPGFVADGATPDGDSVVWTVERIDGWWDSASMRVDKFPVPPRGELVTNVRENGRPIVLWLGATSGTGQALGELLCFTAMDSIEAPFSCVNCPIVFNVIDPVLDLHASVRRVGDISKRIVGKGTMVKVQIALLAEDPYRYDSLDNPYD